MYQGPNLFEKAYQDEMRRVVEDHNPYGADTRKKNRSSKQGQWKKVLEWFGQEMVVPPSIVASSFREPSSSWSR